jgi:hypothetical protein
MAHPALLDRAESGVWGNPETALSELLIEQGIRLIDLPVGISPASPRPSCAAMLYYKSGLPIIAMERDLRPYTRLSIGLILLETQKQYPPDDLVTQHFRHGAIYLLASCQDSGPRYGLRIHRQILE